MDILLIRHGETALNAARVLQPADTPLSPTGHAQVDALARRLMAHGIGAIVSSDLLRAVESAQAISDRVGLAFEQSALLQERNFGDWRGRPHAEFASDPLAMTQAPPAGESMSAFEARVAAAFADIVRRQRHCGGVLAVVTHGLVIRTMLRLHVHRGAEPLLLEPIANASLSIIESASPHRVMLLNSCEHLFGRDAADPRSLSGG